MKKFLGLLLAFMLLVVPAFAENDGFESKTIDDLLVIKNDLDTEIGKRLGAIGPVYSGTYVVGQDIKAGQYVLHVENAVKGWKVYIQVYALESDEKEIVVERYLAEGEAFSFSLEEGQALYLGEIEVAYLELLEKPAWAP